MCTFWCGGEKGSITFILYERRKSEYIKREERKISVKRDSYQRVGVCVGKFAISKVWKEKGSKMLWFVQLGGTMDSPKRGPQPLQMAFLLLLFCFWFASKSSMPNFEGSSFLLSFVLSPYSKIWTVNHQFDHINLVGKSFYALTWFQVPTITELCYLGFNWRVTFTWFLFRERWLIHSYGTVHWRRLALAEK